MWLTYFKSRMMQSVLSISTFASGWGDRDLERHSAHSRLGNFEETTMQSPRVVYRGIESFILRMHSLSMGRLRCDHRVEDRAEAYS